MTRERLELGQWGEEIALQEIRCLGYRDIIRNYRCDLGEVDIIARDGDTLVFIEIKTRKNTASVIAKEAVTPRKKHQLSKVALCYMKSHDCINAKARFDVVAVTIQRHRPEVEIIKNAFDLAF